MSSLPLEQLSLRKGGTLKIVFVMEQTVLKNLSTTKWGLIFFNLTRYRKVFLIFSSYVQRVPALRAFWDLEKTVLHENRVSGTVLWSPTNTNSPTYTYISQKPW